MATENSHLNKIERERLFPGICLALLPTAFGILITGAGEMGFGRGHL